MLVAAGIGAAMGSVDVPSLIGRSVEANNRDWEAAPGFNYLERDRSHNGSKTYRVSMILGSPYRKLVAVNGEQLPAEEQASEQRKLEEAISQRRNESPEQHDKRVASYQEERHRDHLMLEQLAHAFDFKLIDQQTLDQRRVYVLQARPRPGYVPPNRQAEALTGMQGKLWIDAETNQWVKVEAEVVRPVSIDGFLARVEPGTRFELEYAPVTDDVWLPTHYVMTSRAKLLSFFGIHRQADETYSNYEKAPADLARQ